MKTHYARVFLNFIPVFLLTLTFFSFDKMGKKNKSTKKNQVCPIVGSKKNLRSDVLPTIEQVLRYYLWLDKNCGVSKIVKDVMAVWKVAGIKTVSVRQVTRMWMEIRKKHQDLSKASKTFRKAGLHTAKAISFKAEIQHLFDISACKCTQTCGCDEKLSKKTFNFLHDQRGIRMLKVMSITQHPTCEDETINDSIEETTNGSSDLIDEVSSTTSSSDTENDECEESRDPDYKLPSSRVYNKLDLKPVAEVADRYQVSDQAAAAIATATLVAVGIISGDSWLVITRDKMKRSRNALRQYLS